MRNALALAGITLLTIAASPAECSHETACTGPNVRVIIDPRQLSSQTGFSLMGEVGEKMARVNATIGYQIDENQRLKMSIDQLCQKLDFKFQNDTAHRWVRQIAAGAAYKYFINQCWVDTIDAGGWYSNAANRSLHPFELQTDATVTRSFVRRIAGSEAWHAYFGTTVFPWSGATLGIAAAYDHVDYHRKKKEEIHLSGAGFALDFNQRLFHCVDLNVRGDILQPYQHAGGALNWTLPCAYGDMIVGIYGDYTSGRKGVPNDTSFGIQFNMAFGNSCYVSPVYRQCCVRDCSRPRQDLMEWIADPAVMMPIVLAVSDDCVPPYAVVLPNVTVELGPFSFSVANAFQSNGCRVLTYSAKGLPSGTTIDPYTGVISGTNFGMFTSSFNVQVTASCTCGSVTSSFVLTMDSLI